MTDLDLERAAIAVSLGAVINDAGTVFSFMVRDMLAFAKACEREGRAQASVAAQIDANEWRAAGFESNAAALDCFITMLNAANDKANAALAPIKQDARDRALYCMPVAGEA